MCGRDLVGACGIVMSDEEFEMAFSASAEMDGCQGYCCIDTFMRVRHHIMEREIMG